MSKSKNAKIIAVFCTVLALSAVLSAFRTYLLFNCVEPDSGFYIVGSNLNIYFNIAVGVLVAVILLGTLFVIKNKAPEELNSESTVVVFSSSLCGFLFVTVLLYGIYKFVIGDDRSVFLAIELLLCVPSAINFFCICSKSTRDKSAAQTMLSLSPSIFFAVRIIDVFTDTKTQINVSQRSLELVMLCAMMLLFVCESGFLLPDRKDSVTENDERASVAKYFAVVLFTVAFAVVTVIPYTIVSAFWVYESKFLLMDILDGCIGLYAATRMISLAKR